MIDQEYKFLFDLINEFQDSISRSAQYADTLHVLNRLVTYAQTHFTHEESLMQEHHYPRIEHQAELHAELFTTIFSINEEFAANPDKLHAETLHFLKHWLIGHIIKEDMDIGDFIRRQATLTDKPDKDSPPAEQAKAPQNTDN